MTPLVAQAQLSVPEPGIKEIEFTGDFVFLSDAPVETIEGTVPGAKGRITTNTEDLSQTSGTISVPVMGMKTGNKKRDKHVVGKHWLEAKKYPEITFVSEKIEKKEDVTKVIAESMKIKDRPCFMDFVCPPDENVMPMIPSGGSMEQIMDMA